MTKILIFHTTEINSSLNCNLQLSSSGVQICQKIIYEFHARHFIFTFLVNKLLRSLLCGSSTLGTPRGICGKTAWVICRRSPQCWSAGMHWVPLMQPTKGDNPWISRWSLHNSVASSSLTLPSWKNSTLKFKLR